MTDDPAPGPDPVPPRRIAWVPIILLCGGAAYLVGAAACMVAIAARRWVP